MAWLARSIANTLRLDDDDVDQHDVVDLDDHHHHDAVALNAYAQNDADIKNHSSKFLLHRSESLDLEEVNLEDRDDNYNKISQFDTNHNDGGGDDDDGDHNIQGRGVKEDLSEFTETLTRQLWGVASFLAPPPPPPPPPPPRRSSISSELDQGRREVIERSGSGDEESYDEEEYDSAAQFRDFTQSFLQIGMPELEEEDIFEDAVGITEEALDFAENTAHHPETWLNFPLSEEEEFEDFEISDTQHTHARVIEHLAPRLAALRRELCPVHMTEGYFWMVYFVLLHSRLSKQDDDLLSTPQLKKARVMWMQELQKQTKPESNWLGRHAFHSEENISPYENLDAASFEDTQPRYTSHMAFPLESIASQVTTDSEPEKQPYESREIEFIDKSIFEEDPTSKPGKEPLISPSFKVPIQEYDEHEDDWLDDDSELEGFTGTANAFVNEEDVSFSDLEDDIDCNLPMKLKVAAKD